ncbi:MAG TPA: IS4 family transposase [Atribacter sp.]|uniref:IS4 family transposase n=1 Tax=Atribacter sp. TaxID=2847780 RepID=UPI002C928210|nr:IS4 family transposase [Atribacter sp.]HQK84478.1 IS4 family transposase [Atribacter sp.]
MFCATKKQPAMTKISLFSQIISLLPRNSFDRLANKYQTDKSNKGINSWTHLVFMLFCHIGQASSVRDISNGLRSITGNLNHLGLGCAPSKSAISYINKHRNWQLFKDYYNDLLEHFQSQHTFIRSRLTRLRRKIFILDATIIPLCLSVFNWAKFRSQKGAVKLHLMLDYDGCLPVFADLTSGKVHEINVARITEYPKGSVLVFDMGYIDFKWLHILDSKDIFFVTRAKDNMDYQIVKDHDTQTMENGYIVEDVSIMLSGFQSSQNYPQRLRLVKIWDKELNCEMTFMTNNFFWTAKTVAEIYKERWNIEIFFKSLKQHLHIKTFVGTSPNAVMIQSRLLSGWTALIAMLVLTFLKAKAEYQWHLSNLITFVRLNLFVKIDLFSWLNNPFYKKPTPTEYQLSLFSG